MVSYFTTVAVVPVLVGPLQVLLAILPGLLLAFFGLLAAMVKPAALKKGAALLWRLKWVVLALILVVAGGRYAAGRLMGRRGQYRAGESAAGEWAMFRGGTSRRAAVLDGKTPDQAAAVWSFAPGKEAFYASPTVYGNRVYITSAQYGVFRDRGAIYCLDADSGELVWAAEPDGFRSTFSSPSISPDGRYLVCGEGLHLTQDARVFCLDISPETVAKHGGPSLVWSYRTACHVESSPAIADGRVYVGAGDDGYYCLALEGDGSGGPLLIWHKEGDRFPDAESPPLAAGGRVYVGLGLRGNAVVCLDGETGDEIWRAETPYPVFSPCTLVPGEDGGAARLFVGMGVGDFVNPAEAFAEKEIAKLRREGATPAEIAEAEERYRPAGEVWCLDSQTGEVLWRQSTNRVVLGAVAAAGGRLYCGSRDGNVYCLDQEDGRIVARFNAHEPFLASPACDETHVFAASASGRLYALEQETLQPIWSMPYGKGGKCMSSPSVGRGHVYVGSENAGLFCLGKPGEDLAGPLWAGDLGDGRHMSRLGSVSLPPRGSLVAQFAPDKAEGQVTPSDSTGKTTAPIALLDGFLYLALSSANPPGNGLLVAVPEGEKRAFGPAAWTYLTKNLIRHSPALDSLHAFLVDGIQGETGRHVHCLARDSGELLWKRELAPEATGHLRLFPDHLYVQDGVAELSCLGDDGRELWRKAVGTLAGPPDEFGAILVIGTREPDAIAALDRNCGAELWRIPLETPPVKTPVLRDHLLLVATGAGVEARRLQDGSLIWRAPHGAASSELVTWKDSLAYTTPESTIVIIDMEDGSLITRIEGAVPGLPPFPVDNRILFVGEGALQVSGLEADGTDAQPWMTTSWMGEVITPLAATGEFLYLGTSERGVIRAGKWQ